MEVVALLGEDEAKGVEGYAERGGREVERGALVLDQLGHHVQPEAQRLVSAACQQRDTHCPATVDASTRVHRTATRRFRSARTLQRNA